ncbi:TPR-like protein [Fomitiporia mediterranea MF3/22]|uniref:TPR-like protein n=1 Tax=Fomitiporia mediterranea (strain MF3/22) TaxID=694068 RepID=UPI00044074CD|nr:TPR-like protein [Fomitiporia mediterranea MF3/22]EJD07022.1 TPR-like protein [Fomitiporia mediterranea MF3/22]
MSSSFRADTLHLTEYVVFDNPQTHHILALLHWKRFEQSGEQEELDKSIRHDRTALKLHPDRSESLKNLSISLYTRYERWGQIEDLEEVINLSRAGLQLCPKSHPDYSKFLDHLATSLQTLFKQRGQIQDLNEAIELHRAALELHPKDQPLRYSSLNNLANSMKTRFDQYGQTEDLDEAVELHHATLKFLPKGHPLRPSSLNNLAECKQARFGQHGQTEDLDEAIVLHRTTLELFPESHPLRPVSLNNLATAMKTRFKCHGQMENLDEAIGLFRTALGLLPSSHSNRSASLANLAASLQIRFEQRGWSDDLDEAVELNRNVLELVPDGHSNRFNALSNLANSMVVRFQQRGRAEDLDEAIELHRAALELRPNGHPGRSMSLNNLAAAVRTRFEQHGRVEDLDEAVELFRTALELRPEGHPGRSTSLDNLANVMGTQFEQHRKTEDLDGAVALLCAALELRPNSHPNRSVSLSNLAVCMVIRFEQRGQKEDLGEAILLFRASLELFPEGRHYLRISSLNNLATSLRTRFEQCGRSEDLDEALKLHRAAVELCPEGHLDRFGTLYNLANSVYARVKQQWRVEEFTEYMHLLELAATHKFSGLSIRLDSARRWAELARLHDHDSALSAYKATMSLLQHALTISPTLHEQHNFLVRNTNHRFLAMEAASYSIEKNRMEQAVEILEQGRALLWSQLRGLRTPLDQLAKTNEELVARFRIVSRRLESLAIVYDAPGSGQRAFDKLLKLKKHLSDEQEEVIHEIRRVPEFESFLDATPFNVLQEAASEGPVIMVNHCKYRSDALIILHRVDVPVICVPLDSEFYKGSIKLYVELMKTRQYFGAASTKYDEKLRETMKMLWDRAVSKIVERLEKLGVAKGSHIWWCPTSVLSALPFHAAGPFKDADGATKYLLDDYISSYTPTFGALINAQSGGAEEEATVLVIGDTSLRSAKQEISNIRNCGVGTKLLLGKKASRDAVVKAVREATWVHFVCHGHLGAKPFDSSFNLSDSGLTLLDIVQASLPDAEFAFLSACHTAQLPYDGALDEVLHLAAAIQFSGFRSVIGSMWELLDDDGPHFARTVYEYINDCDEGEPKYKRAAAGLRKAALELKARDEVATERWVNLVHIGA